MPQEAAGFVVCPFCGTGLVLDLTGVRRHFLYRPRRAVADVLPLLRRWCDAHAFPRLSSLSSPRLTYYPFWRYEGRGRPRLIPGWTTLEGRWTAVAAPEAEQVLFDPSSVGGARVVEADVAELAARARLSGTEDAGAGDLVHVPFYELTFAIGDSRMDAALDACSGQVYPRQLPPNLDPRGGGGRGGADLWTGLLGFAVMVLEAVIFPTTWSAAVAVGLTAWALYWLLACADAGAA